MNKTRTNKNCHRISISGLPRIVYHFARNKRTGCRFQRPCIFIAKPSHSAHSFLAVTITSWGHSEPLGKESRKIFADSVIANEIKQSGIFESLDKYIRTELSRNIN